MKGKFIRDKYYIEFELEFIEKNKLDTNLNQLNSYWKFSAMGGKKNEYSGQCLDEQELLNAFIVNKDAMRIVEIWKDWHLNNLTAGTEMQEIEVKKWRLDNNNYTWAYSEILAHLKSIGLDIDRGYKYGFNYLVRVIPEEIVKEITDICNRIN